MFIYKYMFIYIYIYLYICTYIYVCIYIHTHSQELASKISAYTIECTYI